MYRSSGVAGAIVLAWLLIGVLAAFQRGYFGEDKAVNCRTFADTALTIVAGPLNYFGVNPKVECKAPEPSK
jgi:hypothetical protein